MQQTRFTRPRHAADFAAAGGFDKREAAALVEFCVELDNQSDRNRAPADARYRATVDPTLWELAFDSREQVARDFIEFKHGRGAPATEPLPDADLSHWSKLYEQIASRAAFRHLPVGTAADVARDPDLNGFGPWQNAWLLYRGAGANAGRFALAIRGTVFSNTPNAVEDAIFQPVLGRRFLSEAVSFATSDTAQLHSGFLHATFTLLLDLRYGVLPTLAAARVPPGSVLYITGHSQGAAMATLVHAFLYRAMADAEDGPADPFGLRGARYRLKSYAVAQPKPGNYPFAAEFASFTQAADNALVVNNHIDPVPKLPMSLEGTADLETDFTGHSLLARFVRAVGGAGKVLRGALACVLEPLTRVSAEGYGYFAHWESLKPIGRDQAGSSWNFVPAGRVLLVYGTPLADPASDLFFQHHATTYRELIAKQL